MKTKSSLYLDTSALTKLYLIEPETPEVARRVRMQQSPIPFGSLHELEFSSAFERRRAAGEISEATVKQIWRAIESDLRQGVLQRIDLDWPAIFSAAVQLVQRHGARVGLRALDSLHLACALELKSKTLITFDERQSRAAALEGMETN